jgi:beta-lactamase regulating signal transducer with metallopeptidase domain
MPSISNSVAAVETASKSIDPRNIITAIWIFGAIIFVVWYLSIFLIYRRKVEKYPIIDDKDIIKNSDNARHSLNISPSEKIILRYGDTAQTMPHLVILPHDYTYEEIHQILLHELCHYRHHDYAKLWCGLLMICVNWFNPLMWYAFKLFRADIEILCDDRVLKITNSKKEYARTLVKSAMMKNRFVPGAASVHNGKNEVKHRVKRIASLKKINPAWMIAAIFICVTVSCICLTDAVSTAVENSVEITSTPEPVALIPTAVPTAQPVISDAPAEAKTNNVTYSADTSYSDNSYDLSNDLSNDLSYEDELQEVGNISIYSPTERESAQEIQVPKIDANSEIPTTDEVNTADIYIESGNKSTYELDDGRTVVLQYDGDTLATGYILNN